MTSPTDLVTCDACPARRSTLPFNLADMIAVRLLPAQFARVLGVSKQSVSKWIHAGKVTLGPDGRLDPVKAIQEVLKNTAPTRLRARIFRQAMEGADAMRVELRALQFKCRDLEAQLSHQRTSVAAAEAALQRQATEARDEREAHARRVLGAFRWQVIKRFDYLAEQRAQGWEALRWALEEITAATLASDPSIQTIGNKTT